MTRLLRAGSASWPPGAFVLFAVAVVLAVVDIVAVPVILREQATDWRAYEGGAHLLATGGSLYGWTVDADVRAITDYPYIYPPPMAAIWGVGLTAELFAGLKIGSLAAMAAFAWMALSGAPRTRQLASGLALAGLALASPPVVHDLVLGNVMTLYLATVALAIAMPRAWWSGIPIGFVVAIALKPAIAPFLIWMLIRRRQQFLAAFGAGLLTTAVFGIVIGPGVYLEYLAALPSLGGLAQPFSGNLGLSSIAPWLAIVAIPVAIAWAVWASLRLTVLAAAVVALAVSVLVQPTLGLNYGALLVPAVAALWFVDRRAALAAGLATPILALLSPPLAGVILAGTATVVGRQGAQPAPEPALASAP